VPCVDADRFGSLSVLLNEAWLCVRRMCFFFVVRFEEGGCVEGVNLLRRNGDF
jgi:hypothetical protein